MGDKATYLKLGLIHPLSEQMILDFAKKFDKIYVIEELDSIIEDFCRAHGVNVAGKELFSYIGEYSAEAIRSKILGENTEYITVDGKNPGFVRRFSAPAAHTAAFFMC